MNTLTVTCSHPQRPPRPPPRPGRKRIYDFDFVAVPPPPGAPVLQYLTHPHHVVLFPKVTGVRFLWVRDASR